MSQPAGRGSPAVPSPAVADGGVLIVDDHELLAQSLAFALRAEGVRAETVRTSSREHVLDAVRRVRPAVVLLDLDLGDRLGSGVPLIPTLGEGGARVVVLTGSTDPIRLAECLEAGAADLASKADPFADLVGTVLDVARGRPRLSRSTREQLLARLHAQRGEQLRRTEAFARLTPREQQVLGKLLDGLSAEAIAAEWVVSLATVRSQIRAVLMKLGVNSQLAAVALARRSGWCPPPG